MFFIKIISGKSAMTNFKEAAILCKSYTIDTKSNPYSKACYKLQLLNKILFV